MKTTWTTSQQLSDGQRATARLLSFGSRLRADKTKVVPVVPQSINRQDDFVLLNGTRRQFQAAQRRFSPSSFENENNRNNNFAARSSDE
ncbi:MAG: hypothetical protein IKR48_03760 [Kiritimatiellae bacterium]|nr:hypothetical protein [Kiritimatiellia bacterium]